jgi:hypothetical protein
MNKKSSNNEKILNAFNNDLNDLVFFSFRYFLGRMSAKVSGFTENLINAWPNLNDKTKKQIKRELEKAIEEDSGMRNDHAHSSRYYPLGMDCDRECWIKVMQAILADEERVEKALQLEEDKLGKWSNADLHEFYEIYDKEIEK